MAFRRKDVKKSSYYVWFLGAKEAKGLRGEEFVLPVMHQLLDQERMIEPSKVTIQVSNKGLKIIQNVPKRSAKGDHLSVGHHQVVISSSAGSSPTNQKTEQIKHLIPNESITTVVQEEDLVCCLLLIFNPVTKCPVHVHGYRCDSSETASALTESLQVLIDRPENQKKFSEIEKRLALRSTLIAQKATASSSLLPAFQSGMRIPGGVHHHREQQTGNGMLVSSPHRRSQGGSSSDGRSSTRTQGSDGTEDSNCFHIMKNMKHAAAHTSLLPPSCLPNQQHLISPSSGPRMCRKESFLNMSSAAMRHHRADLKHVASGSSGRVAQQHQEELNDEAVEEMVEKEHLFESLAHELKVKLSPSSGPILLPPRDYDTISRGRGNLNGIDERKSTNQQIVGVLAGIKRKKQLQQMMKDKAAADHQKDLSGSKKNAAAADKHSSLSSSCGSSAGSGVVKQFQARSEVSSSGKSSGIGSEEALAIIHENTNSNRKSSSNNMNNNSSSKNSNGKNASEGGRSARMTSFYFDFAHMR